MDEIQCCQLTESPLPDSFVERDAEKLTYLRDLSASKKGYITIEDAHGYLVIVCTSCAKREEALKPVNFPLCNIINDFLAKLKPSRK